MSDIVAELRRQMVFRQERGDTLALVPLEDLDTLLSIVEGVATADLNNAHLYCPSCDGDVRHPRDDGYDHAPDCPWLAARRACGMEDAE